MTDQPYGVDATTTSTIPAPAIHDARAPGRRLGWGSLSAIIAGGVLLLALTFGGGMATAWGLGLAGGPQAGPGDTSMPGGTPPGFGNGGPSRDQTLPGRRGEDSDSDDSSSGQTAPNS